MSKLCIGCEHFTIDFGHPDWSELTPGDPPSITCAKQLIDVDPYRLTTTDFRRVLETAETCPEYSFREPEKKEPTFTDTFSLRNLK